MIFQSGEAHRRCNETLKNHPLGQNLAKYKIKSLVQHALNPFFGWFKVPKNPISVTWSVISVIFFRLDTSIQRTPTTHFSAKWTKKTNNYAQQCHKSWSFLLHQKRVTITNLIFPRAHTTLTSFNQWLSILHFWKKNHI